MTQERIQEFITLQTKLNELVHPQWHKQNYDWTQAALMEAVEAYDSLPWKWWKHQTLDTQNLQTELIDVFHFILSKSIELDIQTNSNITQEVLTNLTLLNDDFVTTYQALQTQDQQIDLLKTSLKELTRALINRQNLLTIFAIWFKAYTLSGLNLQDLQRIYLTKNTLNILRQQLGYKEGTYKKLLSYNNLPDKQEDNKIIFDLQSKLDIKDPDFTNKLKSMFLEVYQWQ